MTRLKQAIAEQKEFMALNMSRELYDDEDDGSFSDDDALEELENECGRQRDGSCLYAGTGQCDWECPFS